MSPLLVGAVAALCLITAAVGLHLMRTMPEGTAELLSPSDVERSRRRFNRAAVMDALGRRFGRRAMELMSRRRLELIRHRLDAAGGPDSMTIEAHARRKAAGTLALGALGVLLSLLTGSIVLLLALPYLGWLYPDLALAAAAKRRQAQIDRELPDFLDVLAVTISAGLGFRNAISRVSDALGGPVGQEFRLALEQMSLGQPRRAAFETLRDRNDSEPLKVFVGALLQAEELGTPLTETTAAIAADLRKEFAQRARREAARAAPRVSLIVTTIVVPGAVVLILAGLIIGSGADFGALGVG